MKSGYQAFSTYTGIASNRKRSNGIAADLRSQSLNHSGDCTTGWSDRYQEPPKGKTEDLEE
jgi:hypothetical protein